MRQLSGGPTRQTTSCLSQQTSLQHREKGKSCSCSNLRGSGCSCSTLFKNRNRTIVELTIAVSGRCTWRLDGEHPVRRGFEAIVHVWNTSSTRGVKPLHTTVARRSPRLHRGTSCTGIPRGRSCLSLRLEELMSESTTTHIPVFAQKATAESVHDIEQGTAIDGTLWAGQHGGRHTQRGIN